MMLLYKMVAGDIMKFHIFYILFIAFSIISIFVSKSQAYAVEGIWRDYESMKELVKDIRNGDKDDDKMNYDKFKDSSVYKNAKEDLRRCIDLADKVGEKLGDYEIVRCFENANYFKEKYVDGNNVNVGQQEQQNETNQNKSSAEEAVRQKELQLTENKSEQHGQQEQQEQQNETNQNKSSAEEAVRQKELQLTENKSEQHGQQEQQNETNQNKSSAEEAVRQKELQLTENKSEQHGQQEQQNETNQNKSSAEEAVRQKELQQTENK